MATRIYFDSLTAAAAYAPAFASGYWTSTVSATRYAAHAGARSSLLATTKGVAETTSSRTNILLAQMCVPLLAEQTISGTVKGQIRALESSAAADQHLLLHVRIVGTDATERGTLFSSASNASTSVDVAGTDTYELDTVATNRKLPPGWSGAGASLSSVDAEAGDLLVIEIGYRSTNTVTTSYTGTIHLGSTSTTDLTEDETETADYGPWLEFSQTLTFLDGARLPASEQVLYLGGNAAAVPLEGQTWPRGAGSW